ncbi:MAG: transglycosylase SLT domain-containing protein [Rhodospirillaceae bacterium]
MDGIRLKAKALGALARRTVRGVATAALLCGAVAPEASVQRPASAGASAAVQPPLPAIPIPSDRAPGDGIAADDDLAPPRALGPLRSSVTLLESDLPELRGIRLADDDARRYRQIFALQAHAAWDDADTEIGALHDRRLVGQVLRQRYLHAGSARVSYDALRAWLKRYGDQAGAERIRTLAEARQPKGAPRPPEPVDTDRLDGDLEVQATWGAGVAPRSRSTMGRTSDGPAAERIENYLHAGRLSAALRVLRDDGAMRGASDAEYDSLRARIAAALFYNGDTSTARTLAEASAARSGEAVPGAHWIAGLAAWRNGDIETAGRHFTAMAATSLTPWEAAAAAYWAGRAESRLGHAETAEVWLERAARYDRTFYGLIAGRTLGRSTVFQWQVPALTTGHLAAIARSGAGARALALLQIGQSDLAEQELRRIHPRDNAVLAEALVALADDAGLPALALQVGNAVAAPEGRTYDAALYPLPHWAPAEGFTLDRALLFAIMRQESRFEPRLISHAGATGVMQIMPETAHDVAGDGADYEGTDRRRLFDPQWNLSLGQRYLASLMTSPQVAGNLAHLTAAYNAGPSNLVRWRRDLEEVADPLLFIESIPMRETRDYVRKVLTNYWIYETRLGQRTATLDALATGGWPVYSPAAEQTTQLADRVGN